MLNAIAVMDRGNGEQAELRLDMKYLNDIEIKRVVFEKIGDNILYEFRHAVKEKHTDLELVVNVSKMIDFKLI